MNRFKPGISHSPIGCSKNFFGKEALDTKEKVRFLNNFRHPDSFQLLIPQESGEQ